MQLLDDGETGVPAPPTLSLNNCLLDSNSASLDGGAAALLAGAATITSGAVSSNTAGGDGGGISVKARRGR
jgi:predicted outer membrane repeat protein